MGKKLKRGDRVLFISSMDINMMDIIGVNLFIYCSLVIND